MSTTTILRLAFAKGSNEIYAGLTKLKNITLTGTIVYTNDLVLSHYRTLQEVTGESIVGVIGTACISDRSIADSILLKANRIQKARPKNERGNKYPFVFLTIETNDEFTIIYNAATNEKPVRLTFLDCKSFTLSGNPPEIVTNIPLLSISRVLPNNNLVTSTRYYAPKKSLASSNAQVLVTVS